MGAATGTTGAGTTAADLLGVDAALAAGAREARRGVAPFGVAVAVGALDTRLALSGVLTGAGAIATALPLSFATAVVVAAASPRYSMRKARSAMTNTSPCCSTAAPGAMALEFSSVLPEEERFSRRIWEKTNRPHGAAHDQRAAQARTIGPRSLCTIVRTLLCLSVSSLLTCLFSSTCIFACCLETCGNWMRMSQLM